MTSALRFALPPIAAMVVAVTAASPVGGQDRGAPVSVSRVETQEIVNVVNLSGSVVAPRTARVSTSVGALVETMTVDLGTRVAEGVTLVTLDAALARHEVERAQAAVAAAEAELADARRRVRVAERLARQDNIAATELDAREAAAAQAAARVKRLEAEARTARERLARHEVTAPFSGVVTDRVAEPGEWVEPGSTLVELAATDRLYVDVSVPQQHYPRVRNGVPIELSFDALPERTVDGRIAAVVPVSDDTARTFTLRVAPSAEGDLPLTPGMSARAELRLATGETGPVIPRGAVIRYPDGRTTVWILDRDDDRRVARERQVELGRTFDGMVHVRDGLEAGTRVVVRGNETLRPGQPVQVSQQSAS